MMKEGKLTTVAKTGGLKLDNEQVWINPTVEVKKMITAGELNIEKVKEWLNQMVAVELDSNGYWLGVQILELDEETENIVKKTEVTHKTDSSKLYITLGGKDYITHQGLLSEAHKKQLTKIYTELISGGEIIVFKATAETADGKLFSAYGDASKESVNKMIAPHIIRMAETRAINRALRLLTNIGMTSIDELGEVEPKEEEK